ncbi:MAG TPA: efflux RND transporter periplasmic adaptor subunit [Steroidobacteraceae bacterium]|nr:efflux RND transporter periplasmic adaptor subunit [Steroidobacteraceae bacterium]
MTHRKTSMTLRPALAAPVLISLLSVLVSACAPQAAPAPPAPQVSVAEVLQRDVSDWDEFTGRTEAIESVEVRPRVSGYIERVAFTEGSTIKKGDLLFVIDPRPYRAELDKAEAELVGAQASAELARNEVARGNRLLAARAISQEEYDQRINAGRESDASVRAAKAALETAQLNLSFTRVISPIDGRVSKAEVTVGNLVSGGTANSTLLTSVVSIDPIYVAFEGDERVYLKYANLGQLGELRGSSAERNQVQVALANEADFSHDGELVFLDNQLNPATGTIRARALLDNHDGRLTPGLFARVKLVGSEVRRAVVIDDRAVGTDQDQKFVYVVGTNNVVDYRAVKLGRLFEGLRIVEQGLEPGERIVVNGLQRVRPGVTIAPELVSMDRSKPESTRVAKVP